MSKINSIKGNIWTNKEGATAENTFIEVVDENVKYGLPGDGSGDSFDGINQFNSKDSNIYYGQMVNRNSVIKINAEKMKAFFYKYYTKEQIDDFTFGSSRPGNCFVMLFRGMNLISNYNDYLREIQIFVSEGDLYYDIFEKTATGDGNGDYQTEKIEIGEQETTLGEWLDMLVDIEIPLNIFSGSVEIREGDAFMLTNFFLTTLDPADNDIAQTVDFNEKPIDWIEIVQNEEA